MLGHLKYTVGAYNQEPDDRGVHPISLMDAHIITKITAILKHRGMYDLSQILENWKKEDDNDFMDQLDSFMEEQGVDESAYESELDDILGMPSIKRHMIDIGGHIFEVSLISRLDKEDIHQEGSWKYLLVINKGPLPAKENWYQDTTIEFFNQEDRDLIFEEIKEKLEKYKNIQFI